MASSYLTKTFGTPTDQNKWTWSGWVKLGQTTNDSIFFSAGTNASNNVDGIKIDTNALRVFSYPGSYVYHLISNRKFRDLSGWYHFQVAYDSDQSTAADRVKCYVNGTQLSSFSTETYPSSGANAGHINLSGREHIIGADTGGANNNINGYVTHVHFADGQAYAPTVFGETDSTSGIWKPKTAPSVTYGNNGFFLKFENAGSLGTDSSGNGNNFTVNGTPTQSPDTPSNNFATLNPLDYSPNPATLQNGNTTYNKSSTGSGHNASMTGTLGVMTGKWYFEFKETSGSAFNVGMVRTNHVKPNSEGYYATDSGSYAITNSGKIVGGSSSSVSYSHSTNDIFGMAYDLTNGKFYVHVNGTYITSGDPTSGSTGTGSLGDISLGSNIYVPLVSNANYEQTTVIQFNFGSGFFGTTAVASANADANGFGAFEYAVPSGYYALCTKNIKEFG